MTLVRYYPRTAARSGVSDEWRPAVDVVEHENDYVLWIDLPGFEKSE